MRIRLSNGQPVYPASEIYFGMVLGSINTLVLLYLSKRYFDFVVRGVVIELFCFLIITIILKIYRDKYPLGEIVIKDKQNE